MIEQAVGLAAPIAKPALRVLLRRVLTWLGEPVVPATDPRTLRLTWYHSRRSSRRRVSRKDRAA